MTNTSFITTSIETFNRAKAMHDKCSKNVATFGNATELPHTAIERLCKRHSTTTNAHIYKAEERQPIDTVADKLTELTAYKCNIDYVKSKITLKSDKLIARVYVKKNGTFRVSNYISGNGKAKQTANSIDELVTLVTA